MPTLQLDMTSDQLVKQVAAALRPAITEELRRIITKEVMESMQKADTDARDPHLWVKWAEYAEELFSGHTRNWVTDHIVEKWPEVLLANNPETGWLKDYYGRGSVTRIYKPLASKWINDHYSQIDWESK